MSDFNSPPPSDTHRNGAPPATNPPPTAPQRELSYRSTSSATPEDRTGTWPSPGPSSGYRNLPAYPPREDPDHYAAKPSTAPAQPSYPRPPQQARSPGVQLIPKMPTPRQEDEDEPPLSPDDYPPTQTYGKGPQEHHRYDEHERRRSETPREVYRNGPPAAAPTRAAPPAQESSRKAQSAVEDWFSNVSVKRLLFCQGFVMECSDRTRISSRHPFLLPSHL